MKGWRLRLLVVGVLLVVVAVGAFVARGPLLAGTVGLAGRLAGYDVRYDDLHVGGGHVRIARPDVSSLHHEPVFTAAWVDVTYDPRTLLRGPHLFGISAIDIERPKLTVVHHRDGSYNLNIPASRPNASPSPTAAPSGPAKPFVLPQIRVGVHDGSIGIIDETRIFRHSRRFALENVQLAADVDPHALSRFTFSTTLVEDGGAFPIAGRGRFDPARGYELARVRARTLAIAPLLDYGLDSTSLHFAGGVLNDVDARVYGLLDRTGAMERHVSVTANLDHFQPYLNSLAKPLRDGRGAIRIYDAGLALPKVDGSIAGVPVRIAGAVYDLARPTLRLGISGRGDLARLLTLSGGAKHLDAHGPIAFRLFVEGDATSPQTLASFSSPHLVVDRIPLDRPSGLVALDGPETAIVRSSVRYAGIDLGARGRIVSVGRHSNVELVARVAGSSARLPYASTLAANLPLEGLAVVSGTDAHLAATGSLDGANATQRLAGTFALDGRGVGTIGPISLTGPGDRALLAYANVDRSGFRAGSAYLYARDLRFSTRGTQPRLPGLNLAAVPPVDGTLDASIAGAFAGQRVALGGEARLRDARAFGATIDDLAARARVTDGTHVAVDARYRGSLAALAGAAGRGFAVRGRADVPISLVASGPRDALVAIDGARFSDASVGGVALGGLSAAVRVRGRAYDVYGARLTLGGNDVLAHGSFGNGGTLALSAGGVDLAALRGLGLPVAAGRVTAVADVGGTTSAPTLAGGIAVAGVPIPGAAARGLGIEANAGLSYANDTFALRDGLVRAGDAVGSVDGRVVGVRDAKTARYDVAARVRQADIATLVRVARLSRAKLAYPEGSLDADLHVTGAGRATRVAGNVAIPEGSINGLRFRGATVALAGTASSLRADGGHVTVGSSVLDFDAAISSRAQSVALHAPHVDLADFNDFFDRGDTLGGRGSIAFSARNAPNDLATDGRVRIARARVRRFELGDARADWSTRGRTIAFDGALGGNAGRLTSNGTIGLAASAPLRDALHRSDLAVAAHARGVDLGTWLPVAGVSAPVLGSVDADARARGRFPDIALDADASLARGLVGRVPIRTATLAAHGTGGRATISDAVLAIEGLRVDASGAFGLRPGDAMTLRADARTPDVGLLAKTFTGKTFDASGAANASLRVAGTFARPTGAATLETSALRYARYTLPHARVDATLDRTRATLARAQVDFTDGRLVASGFAPIERDGGLRVGPADAPIALDVNAQKIGLGQFAALLPKGTIATGTLDGRVGVGGTIATPALVGTLALAGGTFAGPQLRSKLTDARARLAFAGSSARLSDAHASVGGGTLDASGTARLPSLRAPARDVAYALDLRSTNAVLDAPQYLHGRVNGGIDLRRAAGGIPRLSGQLALSSTRVPLSAIFNPSAPQSTATPSPLALALDLGVDVGRDVRVQGGPVDIGAQGQLRIGGTIAAPTASGELDSTGGTLSFYRTFRLADPSTVVFDPSNGVIPSIDANATTTVDNPPTDVALHVTGPATHLNVGLASDPTYSREQILGLLVGAQALGAVSGVRTVANSGPQQNPFQAAAEGQLGTLLTQNVLEPFSSQLGGAVGLSNLAINYSPGGSVDVGAQKKILKDVNAVFAESFNYPPRESLGLRASPNDATAVQLTFFSQPASNKFDTFSGNEALLSTNQSVTSTQPANGTNGFSLSIQRRFR